MSNFHANPSNMLQRSEVEAIRKIVDSQPHRYCAFYDSHLGTKGKGVVPLHVHPDAQRIHTSGKTRDDKGNPLKPNIIPDDLESVVHVCSGAKWKSYTAAQKQETVRIRG